MKRTKPIKAKKQITYTKCVVGTVLKQVTDLLKISKA